MEKNRKKYSLKSSLLLLLFTLVLLIVSTYAWFTSNQTVSVTGLEVNVEAKNGLQISVDGTNWKSIIQSTDILGAHTTYGSSTNQLPKTLEPVSTAGNVNTSNGYLEMFYGVVETDDVSGDYLLTAAQSTEVRTITGQDDAAQKFIAFDLFFKVNEDTNIYLGKNSKVLPKEGTSSRGIENAARVAFLNEGNADAGESVANIQALKGSTNATRYIWEPNYNIHTAAGVANARDTYNITTTTTAVSPLEYEGVKANIAKSDNVLLRQLASGTYGAFLDSVTPQYRTVKDFTTNLSIFPLQAGITKVRFYMWIEGQDVDCENNASNSDIVYNVEITTLDV